ncbi:hypothetical protein [Flavobacterium sp. MK4S-17]|uniref:hypothetical protein n=1 Tax=Flavobacterium sp. MK4S-17 TaxID=2543737 RepID=UPI00135CBB61|nr:hypothetical protein [Flavobacterium sp. MK4S-17]
MKKDKDAIHKATLPQHLNALYLRLKLAWAEWMDHRSRRLARRGQYIALVLFVTVSSCCCLLLLLGATRNLGTMDLAPVPISKVKAAVESPAAVVNDSLLETRVRRFRKYMDSLARSPSGRRIRDSIVSARPGLIDSIRMAESLIKNRKTNTYEKQ